MAGLSQMVDKQHKIITMDYTIKDCKFYKVIENGVVTSTGQMNNISLLSTIHEVVFLTKEEYIELTGKEVREDLEPIPEYMIPPVIEDKSEE